jgi:hypothetical protein
MACARSNSRQGFLPPRTLINDRSLIFQAADLARETATSRGEHASDT